MKCPDCAALAAEVARLERELHAARTEIAERDAMLGALEEDVREVLSC